MISVAAAQNDWTMVAVVVAGLLMMVFIFIVMLANRYVRVGPNEALVVSGLAKIETGIDGRARRSGVKIVRGGGVFVFPILQRAEILSLEVRRGESTVSGVGTSDGRSVTLAVKAQFRIGGDPDAIEKAAERFLSKTAAEFAAIVMQELENPLRMIVKSMTAEEVARDRERAAEVLKGACAPPLAAMGVELLSVVVAPGP